MSDIRKLRTILFADIAGYTSLMQNDEPKALQLLQRIKSVHWIMGIFGIGCKKY